MCMMHGHGDQPGDKPLSHWRRWAPLLALAAAVVTACAPSSGSAGNGVDPAAVAQPGAAQAAAPLTAAALEKTGTTNASDAFRQAEENALATLKTNQEGPVTIKARLVDSHPVGATRPFRFSVSMDTHSVNLDAIDLSGLAVLRNDRGNEVAATRWEASRGGHHVEGTLSFPNASADGAALHRVDTKSLELIIRDVGNVSERRMIWGGEAGAAMGAQ